MMQSDNNDEKERTEVDDGALHDQSELSTQKFEMLKDADDKQDFESVGADVGETVQGNPATLQTNCHQVHTIKTGTWQSWSRKPHVCTRSRVWTTCASK